MLQIKKNSSRSEFLSKHHLGSIDSDLSKLQKALKLMDFLEQVHGFPGTPQEARSTDFLEHLKILNYFFLEHLISKKKKLMDS